ncbi:MAG: DUF4214 domain-containing protein [Acidimicrobiales bacterium]
MATAFLILAAVVTVSLGPVAHPQPAAAAGCTIGTPSAEYAAVVDGSALDARSWRLYQAYFLRQPDPTGHAYWLGQMRSGLSLGAMSYLFERSAEFEARYGPLDNGRFLRLVYANVMCREPDAGGYGYWLDRLDRGLINRGDLMLLFSESAEFQLRTGTHWSLFTDADTATLAGEGYQLHSLPGGEFVLVDYSRVDFRASRSRCSVASINGNWLTPADSRTPVPIGFAVIDGRQLPGSYNRDDRGVFGERFRPGGPDVERTYPYPQTTNLNSNLEVKGDRVLESWRMWLPSDPGYAPPPVDNPSEWRWAAAGIPLLVNGQVWDGWSSVPTNDYTHYTLRHSFVAFDKTTNLLAFGTTTGLTSGGLIWWAQQNGYEDLIKFDGGGSAELNVDGALRVAGTGRAIPLWLGVGC